MSRTLHYFNDREYAILQMLDGRRSLTEIAESCADRFAPDHLSIEALVSFLAQACRSGLVLASGRHAELPGVNLPGDGRRASRPAWWRQLLAIRFRGITPDRLLDDVVKMVRPKAGPAWIFAGLALVSVGLWIVVTRFGALTDQIAAATTRSSGSWLALLVVVIAVTKIIHELAHAFACRWFGAECREIGIMLLVGIPCLYCDVTDAWMLPKRRQRVLVSAAGMMAELLLACLAAIVWIFAAEGPLRDLCVTIMVVCSVSTVLFNGNPLLRYDGYYILSDVCGIPNLAQQSRRLMQESMRRIFWGLPRLNDVNVAANTHAAASRRRWMIGYAVASGLYRFFVYTVIWFMIYRFSSDKGLGVLAVAMLIAIVLGTLQRSSRAVLASPSRSMRRVSDGWRPIWIITGLVAIIVLSAMIPLPRTIVAPLIIRPAGAQEVFATTAGRLVDGGRYGQTVTESEVLAVLRNEALEQEGLRLDGECDTLQTQLDALRRRRTGEPSVAAQIPTAMKMLDDARQRRKLHQIEVERLTLRSPAAGRLFAADVQVPADTERSKALDSLEHQPLSPLRRGSWIDPGTMVCIVGDMNLRAAVLWVRQQDIPLVRQGQDVRLLLPDWNRGSVVGHVVAVSTSPVDSVNREVLVAGMIRMRSSPTGDPVPEETYYRVRISLDASSVTLPARLTGRAKVRVAPASIVQRATRWIHQAFQLGDSLKDASAAQINESLGQMGSPL